MPDKIVFVLSEYYLDFVNSHIDILNLKVSQRGTSISLIPASCLVTVLNSSQASFESLQTAYRQTLFITDDPECFSFLSKKGLYAIALYHQHNKNQSFPGALYAVEDIFQLEYRSYVEAYQRLAGIPWDILETPRLIVRESTLSDIPDFYRIYRTPSVTDYMEPLFDDPKEETAYLEAYIKQVYGFYGFGIWTVILKETGQIIGRAGLNIREGYDLPELGFVIEANWQNQGLAFEVCDAILTYAKKELALTKLQAFVKEDNLASRHLLKKLGFSYHRDVLEKGREYQLYTITLLS